eukprot:TRINITY_DN7805_c0_g2_i1.p1 TRINITY_DN7805_c0_g2~~TRINITY_DN7805_c0_g2_i1.p1  ORF type:complete len:240 (-),score=26.08 TRINITY_DN7805_c0_g2_i1:179-898(-)
MGSSTWVNARRSRICGQLLLFYFICLTMFRYSVRGCVGLYELLWACNIAIVVGAYGMLTYQKDIVACSISMVSLAHLLWIVDASCYLLFNFFPVGAAKYLADPSQTVFEVFFTLHHVWFIPMSMSVLYKNGPLGLRGLGLSVVVSIILGLVSRLTTPLQAEFAGTVKYVNINMSHEMWRDVPHRLFHLFDDYPPIVYLPFAILLLNVGNCICFVVWKILYDTFFWSTAVHVNKKINANR